MADGDKHTMLGQYELIDELGRGAMARVWRAWDSKLSREVAIKEPLFDPRLPSVVLEEMGARFVKEAVTAARLNHPGIVTIFAADVFDGHPAIVMELVEGTTLSSLLDKGPLNQEAALDALNQLLDAVGYAHAHGVVHRDIKPDNIFVTNDGHVKLADFGIARVEDIEATKLTVTGTILGTPGYMSPEQIKGDVADARSDLFSIGVVAYEMLTGHNPFGIEEGISATTLAWRVVNEPVADMCSFDGGDMFESIRNAVMMALEKDPANRPQSAQEFKALMNGGAPNARRSVPVGVTNPKTKRWLPYGVVGILCAVILAFALGNALTTGGFTSTQAAGSQQTDVVDEASGSTHSASDEAATSDGDKDGGKSVAPEGSDDKGQSAEATKPGEATKSPSGLQTKAASIRSADDMETTSGSSKDTRMDVTSTDSENQDNNKESTKAEDSTEPTDVPQVTEIGKEQQVEEKDDEEVPSPAGAFPREWMGTYTGHSSRASTADGTVFRNVNITFDEVGDDGALRATCHIISDDPGEGPVRGSYTLYGSVDWDSGAIDLRGGEWIEQDTLWYMRQFHGVVDQASGTITGRSADDHNGANETEWNMSAL